MPELTLPANGWEPRSYQVPVWSYFENGGTRAALAWHRRAGKDDIALHLAATKAMERVGTYWHMLPEASQARKAIWEAVNPHTGKRRIDEAFPKEIREATREQEMFIRFINGSTWQVVGSDNFNSLVGSPPVGLVCSEWSRANPAAWAYLRPILVENGGWAIFISTFFGRNHHYDLVRHAEKSKDWFSETLSAEVTSVFTKEQLANELVEYIADYGEDEGTALYRQEYLSDPSASVMGAYYGGEMSLVEKEKRLTVIPYDRAGLVYTGWDLGRNDVTAIWFAQMIGYEPRIIDYYQNNDKDAPHYASVLKSKGYAYGGHFLPHDGGSKTIHINKSVEELLREAGINNIHVTPRAKGESDWIAEINSARRLIGKAVFDEEKTKDGCAGLRAYRREWDDKLRTYKRTAVHDWASDPADAFRTLAVNWERVEGEITGAFEMPEWPDMAVA